MKVIIATWLNNFNEPYFSEIFDSDVFESEILDYYEETKEMYNHTVISRSDDCLVFSDGSRINLTTRHVKNSVMDLEQPYHRPTSGNEVELDKTLRLTE